MALNSTRRILRRLPLLGVHNSKPRGRITPHAALVLCAFILLGPTAWAGAAPTGAQTTSPSNPCPGATRDYWKPDGQAGDLQFEIPAGWRQMEDQGGPMLVPPGLQPGKITHIGFLGPQTLAGGDREYFEAVWREWQKQFSTIDNGQPEFKQDAKGFTLLRRYSRIYSPQLGNGTFTLVVARSGNRVEAYWYIDNTGSVDYDQAFRAFEHSVQFANAVTPAPPELGVPCGLSGVYIGWRAGDTFSPGPKVQILVFFPDGNVLRHLPEKGLENFDFGAEIKQARDYCGRYRMMGNQFKITWADSNTVSGAREGGRLTIEGFPYVPAANSDGLRPNGTYRVVRGRGVISLAPDGRFTENGILDSVGYHGPDKSPGSGTYTIRHHTVALQYVDGRNIPLSFYIFVDDAASAHPKLIHFNTYDLLLTP